LNVKFAILICNFYAKLSASVSTYRNYSTAQPLANVMFLLFQTLAKVVDGWKKHESEKVAIINQLKVERENAELSQQRQQEVTILSNVLLAISNDMH